MPLTEILRDCTNNTGFWDLRDHKGEHDGGNDCNGADAARLEHDGGNDCNGADVARLEHDGGNDSNGADVPLSWHEATIQLWLYLTTQYGHRMNRTYDVFLHEPGDAKQMLHCTETDHLFLSKSIRNASTATVREREGGLP